MVEQQSVGDVQGSQNPNLAGGEGKQEGPAIKKLKSEDAAAFRESPYFKIRSIVKELRPNFIEVIQSSINVQFK
jgi:hydrogenase maturation factor HypE